MSEREFRLDICPECKVREEDSSEKKLYQCQYCERWFCERHLEPRLTVIRDFKTVIKDTTWRNMIEKEWRRKDGHPDFAYTWEKFEELKIEKAIIGAKMEALLDKSKGYRKPVPRETKKERKLYFVKEESPSYQPKTRRQVSIHQKKLRKYFQVLPNLIKIGLVIFPILLVEYFFLKAYFNTTAYIFVALGTTYIIYKLFIIASRIRVTSDLRLWGLRILSVLTFVTGIFLVVGVLMSYAFTAFTPEKLDNPAYMSVFIFFGVLGFGLMLLSSYLMFRFMLKSGVIVYRR